MAEFWYHSTFDESVELLRDVLARFPARIVHLPKQTEDRTQATSSPTPELLDTLRDGLVEIQRPRGSTARFFLAIPGVTPQVELKPAANDPSLFVLANAQHLLSFDLGRCQDGRGMDAPLRCPQPIGTYDPIEIENAFDDLVEGALKPKLVQAESGGARYFLTPSMHEATKERGGLIFGGVLPRRRMLGIGNPRIVHEPPSQRTPEGSVSASRGQRPAVQIVYQRSGSLVQVRIAREGPDEHLIELLEVLARSVQSSGAKLIGMDDKLAFLLGEERRFGAVRAPTPPRARPATEREVPAALARLCRDALLVRASGQHLLHGADGRVTWSDQRAEVCFAPAGLARPGYQEDVRWTFEVDSEQLSAIGKRLVRRVAVVETTAAPDEAAKRAEIERIFKPLVADGAVRIERYGLPYDQLKELCAGFFLATDDAQREAAFRAIVEALETHLGAQLIRLDELRAALERPSEGPDAVARATRLPDQPSALAEHPRLSELVAALKARAASVTLIAATQVGPSLRVPIGPVHSGTVLEEVLPYLRSRPPAPDQDRPAAALAAPLRFEIDLAGDRIEVLVPRRALRAVPRLRAMVYEATHDQRLAASPAPSEPRLSGEPWSLTILRRAAQHTRALTLHACGVAWLSQRRGAEPTETFWCMPTPHGRFRTYFEALEGPEDTSREPAPLEVHLERRHGNETATQRRRIHGDQREAMRLVDEIEAFARRAHDV